MDFRHIRVLPCINIRKCTNWQDDNEDDNDGQGDLEALLGDESGGHDNAGHGGGGGSVRDKGVGVKDGRRTWTDAESDRLREVMEQPGGE